LFPLQIDFNKIAQALELSKESMKGAGTVPDSALLQLEMAEKQLQEALLFNASRLNGVNHL
jgi:hypothetical protein